jgi:hypothetical protein
LATGSEAMGGAPCCRDFGPSRHAPKVVNDGGAHADDLMLGHGGCKDVVPPVATVGDLDQAD